MGTLYDIKGNKIIIENNSNSGSSGGSSGTITVATDVGFANMSADFLDKRIAEGVVAEVVNILDVTKSVVGQLSGNGAINSAQSAQTTSDYIHVKGGQSYIAQSWDSTGNTSYDKVVIYDINKNPLETAVTKKSGDKRYATFTPAAEGYVRYCYNTVATNPMVFMGSAITNTFVEYNPNKLEPDVAYEYSISSKFKDMILRDVVPSNIYGKNVYMIGDSNSDNWCSQLAPQLEAKYNCKVKGYGQFGASWGYGRYQRDDGTWVYPKPGYQQYDEMIADLGIDPNTLTLPDNSVFLFMMGTNTSTNGVGEITEPINKMSEDRTQETGTDLSVANYILKRMKYFSRNSAIGVIIPWCCPEAKAEGLIKLCKWYKIPYININDILCDEQPFAEFLSTLQFADGKVPSQTFITDGGNHFAVWGKDEIERIIHHWIAYEI